MRSGMATASCTAQSGQLPPKRANCRRVALCRFGDVAGHVEAAKEEGNAALPGALQRREPMAGLLEADAVKARERVDVVAQFAGACPEGAVGHGQRAGSVVGKAEQQ